MVQYWQVINLDKREALGQEPSGELADIVLSSTPDALFFQLVHISAAARGASDRNDNTASVNANPNANANARRGSWAGDRIVVISDYALTYPEGMLTQKERDEVEDMYLDEEDEYDDEDPAPTLYAYAEEWYPIVPAEFVREEGTLFGPKTTVAGDESADRGAGAVWHLRNLTKKEYVRSDAVASACPEKVRERFGKVVAPGLGHALVVCGCWTSEVEVFGKEEIGQGTWAGGQIEIRLAGEVQEEVLVDGWKDVSEQVVRKLAAVWTSREV
ncbi:hypothetical protein AX15_002061 [Amanita polypyramis BW_CC]|nr:hypothetical protein AX15_002061 [Amanita polypyramis BW_CC]